MAFSDQVIGAESGGDPAAQNPNSSAAGPGQFIDSTWLNLIKQNRPDLAAGKTDAAILGMRTDPAYTQLNHDMVDAYATQNAQALTRAGFEASPSNLYLSHFAGPGGAVRVLSAPPGASAAAILGPTVVQANPFLRNMTAADLTRWAAGKVSAPASPPPPPAAGAGPVPVASAAPPADAAAPGTELEDSIAGLQASREQEDQLKPAPMMRLRRILAGKPGMALPPALASRLVDIINGQT